VNLTEYSFDFFLTKWKKTLDTQNTLGHVIMHILSYMHMLLSVHLHTQNRITPDLNPSLNYGQCCHLYFWVDFFVSSFLGDT
jgi:hypothetical protein